MERGGGRESVAVDAVAATDTVSQRRVAIEVAGLAVWGGAQRRTKLTDEQVPLPLSASASALPLEQGTIGPNHRHYNCRQIGHMKTRAIILLLLLLLPLVPAMAQEQEEFEAIPMTYQKKKPSFNGGDANDFSKWVNEHKNYPEEAKKAGIEGRVTTQFTITKEGKLINVRILRGIHPLLDEEAIRVIESAPQIWKPGEKKGKPVDVTYTFPVIFKLTDEERAQVDSVPFVAFDYGVKERKPSFNNGDYFVFAKWIREHLVYPEDAKKAGLEGRVYVSVTIDEKGKLVNPAVYRSTNKIFEEEALRVISSAPDKWKPGLNAKGEPMALSLLIPVNFNLPNK